MREGTANAPDTDPTYDGDTTWEDGGYDEGAEIDQHCAYYYGAAFACSNMEDRGPMGVSNYNDAKRQADAAKAAVAKLKDKPNCDKLLGKLDMTFSDMQGAVASENFQDGTQSQLGVADLFFAASLPGDFVVAQQLYGNQTIQQYLASSKGNSVAALACAGCGLVFLNYNNFGGGALPDREATIIHEALHNFTGYTDAEIQTMLGLKVQSDSSNISTAIYDNCL